MNTKTYTERLFGGAFSIKSLLWAALVVAIIAFFLAPMVQGAVVVTAITEAPSTTGSHGRFYAEVGNGVSNPTEARLIGGSPTSSINYMWQLTDGFNEQSIRTPINIIFSGDSMTASLNGVSLGPLVNYSTNPESINTLFIFLRSDVSEGNRVRAESMTLLQNGLGGIQSLDGNLVAQGGQPDFSGVKVEFNGGTGDIELGLVLAFERDFGFFDSGFGDDQQLHVVAFHNPAIPEPSALILVVMSVAGLFRRKR